MLDKSKLLYFENFIDLLDEKSKSALLDVIDMNKKELVLTVHKYKISQLTGKDQRWHTYIPADTKRGIKEIKKNTEKEIIDFLIGFYGLGGLTFSELYSEWIKYKETITESSATIRRHGQHFNKYFVNEKSKLLKMDISKIDKLTLQSECNGLVKKFNMTQKEWQNVKTIINGMFEYAFDKHLINENPCDRLKITVKYRQVNKKTAKTEVYKDQEYKTILSYLDKMYSETGDSSFLAVKFQFFTGVRVGELVALKWEDIDLNEMTIHVHSEEANKPYRDELGKWHDRRIVVPHTKTYTDRDVQLLPKALEVLEHIQHRTGFIFIRDGERITERQVNYVLEKYAERMGTITKSSHKLRKTYASRMKAGGVSLDTIRKDLGHTNILTTDKYIFDVDDEDKVYEKKANAL